MFKKIDPRKKYSEMEKEIIKFWKDDKTFEKSVKQRSKENSYVFYDGPPFITGVPHYGTLLSSIIKDVVPRYWTMKGKRVERVWGWDCHGLPAENLVERKLGIKDKRDVAKIGVKKYIETCHKAMVQGGNEWEDSVDRIGRWVDFKGAYKTMDKEYMESVWWAFKELYKKKKIYEGEKVLMYCTRCATPISKSEVAMDNSYKEVTDPSVYVKFPLLDEKNTYLLAWTTTPWTLPANTALAVNSDVEYVKIKRGKSKFIIAKDKLEEVFGSVKSKRVYLISGKHAFASREYFPKLKKELVEAGYDVEIIDHIDPSSPDLQENLKALKKYDLDNSHIVTHSLGANTILKYLSDTGINLSSLTMIAPPFPGKTLVSTDNNWTKNSGYMNYEVNFEKVKKQIKNTPIIIYSDENIISEEDFKNLGKEIGASMQREENKAHYFEPKINNTPDFDIVKSLSRCVNYDIVKKFKGKELVGKKYKPLFEDRGEEAHRILGADYVTTEDGTGIVHIAPAYGEEDFELAKKNGVPIVHTVDENGDYTEGKWKGKNVWEVNKEIAKTLQSEGKVMKIDYTQHEYPHCHRCETKLMYRAHPSWFMDIEGQRKKMLRKNKNINWFPEHFKNKRFKYTVETAPDWNLSRDRFWATPIPVWRGKKEDGTIIEKVVGSYAELKELSGKELKDYHLPYVDEITFEYEGVKMRRVEKVMDCWFESGSMPFAQFHYPFENKEKFEENFPGDFITEYVGQVRAWFYYMHAVSIGLFGEESFKNVVVTGTIAGDDGRKMSKSLGNYTEPNILLDKYSSDALRYLLISSPLLNGEDFALVDKDVADIQRKLTTLWSSYSFFVMYANVDNWEAKRGVSNSKNILDKWIVSLLHRLIGEVDKNMQKYDLPNASRPIVKFIDDLSNWYIRRSRKRFWKSENDEDKDNAYATLYYVLLELSKVIAPFTPFVAEEIYKNLTSENSVHLVDFPKADKKLIDEELNEKMSDAREVITAGLQSRAQNQIKVRQPLALATVRQNFEKEINGIIKEELNVKNVLVDGNLGSEIELDLKITKELRLEGMAREIIRHIQQMRKEAGYQVDNRIEVYYSGASEVFDKFGDLIAKETLANEVHSKMAERLDLEKEFQIKGEQLRVAIGKTNKK